MPPKNPWQYDVNQLNNKGLDVIHPIEQVDKDHYSRMEDVKSLQEGTITPRPGTSLVNATALDVSGFVAGTSSETGSGCGVAAKSVLSSSSADTYGSYVTLIASTAKISKWWTISVQLGAGTPDRNAVLLLDISFDAGAGPEVNFIEEHAANHHRVTGSAFDTGDTIEFPFEVPAGSRIRARCNDSVAAAITYFITASMTG